MPLMNAEDFAGGDVSAEVCVFCADENGNMKPCGEIFEGGVEFFMSQTGSDRAMAEKLTRKNMCSLPHWQENGCDCLEGEMATDEELAEAMTKLG